MPLVDLRAVTPRPLALRLVPGCVARRHLLLPLDENNHTLTFATSWPVTDEAEREVALNSGRAARAVLANRGALVRAVAGAYPVTESRAAAWCAGRGAGARRILVADDDPITRMLLRLVLEREGYQVIEAAGVREAADLVEQERPDLLAIDASMPDSRDGMLERLRRSHPRAELSVILLAASVGGETGTLAIDNGADDYIAKPFDPAVLLARVSAALRRRCHSDTVSAA